LVERLELKLLGCIMSELWSRVHCIFHHVDFFENGNAMNRGELLNSGELHCEQTSGPG